MINNNRLQVQRLNPEPVNIVTIQPPIHTNERRQVKIQSGTLIMKDRLFRGRGKAMKSLMPRPFDFTQPVPT